VYGAALEIPDAFAVAISCNVRGSMLSLPDSEFLHVLAVLFLEMSLSSNRNDRLGYETEQAMAHSALLLIQDVLKVKCCHSCKLLLSCSCWGEQAMCYFASSCANSN
jgi:hypothetical protein